MRGANPIRKGTTQTTPLLKLFIIQVYSSSPEEYPKKNQTYYYNCISTAVLFRKTNTYAYIHREYFTMDKSK